MYTQSPDTGPTPGSLCYPLGKVGVPEDEFDDGIDDDPFDDDEWRPTARIDMTDVRRKLESIDSDAKTYDMRKAPDISADT